MKKKLLLSLALLGCCNNLQADDNANINQTTNTNATLFAVQAGAIAGVAKACGLDTNLFLTRANEALERLSYSIIDKTLAQARLTKALQQAEIAQQTNHPMLCSQVVQDFNSLPLMRPDYKQTVIAQLNPAMGNNPTPPPGTYNQSPQVEASNRISNPPPNINTLAPGGTPPPPDFPPPTRVGEQSPPNINNQAPSLGPFTDTTRPAPNINDLGSNPWTGEPPPTGVSNPYAGAPQANPYVSPPPQPYVNPQTNNAQPQPFTNPPPQAYVSPQQPTYGYPPPQTQPYVNPPPQPYYPPPHP